MRSPPIPGQGTLFPDLDPADFREYETLCRIRWNELDRSTPPPPRTCHECGGATGPDPLWITPAWGGPFTPQRPVRYHRACAYGRRLT